MERYDYLEVVTNDAKQAILENLENWNFSDREELEEIANDNLWNDDRVTGMQAEAILAMRGKPKRIFAIIWTNWKKLVMSLGKIWARQ